MSFKQAQQKPQVVASKSSLQRVNKNVHSIASLGLGCNMFVRQPHITNLRIVI